MSNDQKRRGNERYENLAREDPIVMARFKVRSDVAKRCGPMIGIQFF